MTAAIAAVPGLPFSGGRVLAAGHKMKNRRQAGNPFRPFTSGLRAARARTLRQEKGSEGVMVTLQTLPVAPQATMDGRRDAI
jgi:hypothetical protein